VGEREPIEPTLEAALRAGEDVALVYADWYQQRGHPRGQLIVVQRALRERPGDAELRAEEARLIEELIAPTARQLELEWEDGFVRKARIAGQYKPGEGERVVAALLADPSARFLRELVIGSYHGGDYGNAPMAEVILRAWPPPPLHRLALCASFAGPIGDLSHLGARFPELEELTLFGRDVMLGELHLPALRRLTFESAGMRGATLRALLAGSWPELRDLDLSLGSTGYGADYVTRDLAPIVSPTGFPKLRVLRLDGVASWVAFCRKLVASPRARTLDELALYYLDDEAAEVLLAHRHAFAQLEHATLEGELSDDVAARLGEAFPR
jgi:uncharacterized protein (TIGR02996 family)